jgi:hypothetical protein
MSSDNLDFIHEADKVDGHLEVQKTGHMPF